MHGTMNIKFINAAEEYLFHAEIIFIILIFTKYYKEDTIKYQTRGACCRHGTDYFFFSKILI